MGMLLEFPGADRVCLDIHTEGGRVRMDLPAVTTGYCPELEERLMGTLGSGAVEVLSG